MASEKTNQTLDSPAPGDVTTELACTISENATLLGMPREIRDLIYHFVFIGKRMGLIQRTSPMTKKNISKKPSGSGCAMIDHAFLFSSMEKASRSTKVLLPKKS